MYIYVRCINGTTASAGVYMMSDTAHKLHYNTNTAITSQFERRTLRSTGWLCSFDGQWRPHWWRYPHPTSHTIRSTTWLPRNYETVHRHGGRVQRPAWLQRLLSQRTALECNAFVRLISYDVDHYIDRVLEESTLQNLGLVNKNSASSA